MNPEYKVHENALQRLSCTVIGKHRPELDNKINGTGLRPWGWVSLVYSTIMICYIPSSALTMVNIYTGRYKIALNGQPIFIKNIFALTLSVNIVLFRKYCVVILMGRDLLFECQRAIHVMYHELL